MLHIKDDDGTEDMVNNKKEIFQETILSYCPNRGTTLIPTRCARKKDKSYKLSE